MPTTSIRNFVRSIALLGLFLAGAAGANAQTKTNPYTQINWPANCSNSGVQVYNYLNNTCVPASSSVQPIVYRGTWNSGTTYATNDAVFYSGNQYISLQGSNLNQNPATAGTYWALLINGDVTAANMQAALVGQTGCTTPGFAWNPATNTCTAASAGVITFNTRNGAVTLTATDVQSALTALTGCSTTGTAYNPQTNTCLPAGGGTLAGDVTGPSGANTVGKIQGRPVAATAPTVGQGLIWTGSVYTPGASANNVATIIVAASNSPGAGQANIVCSGTNDQTCIQTALDTSCPANTTGQVNGCRVVLKSGVYHVSGSIHLRGNSVWLDGEETPTWGGYKHGAPCTIGSPCADIATGGPQLRATTSGFDLIVVDNSPSPACGPTDSGRSCGLRVSNLYFVGFQYNNAGISGGAPDMSEFDNLMFQQLGACFNFSSDSATAQQIRCQDDGAFGSFVGEHTKISNSLIFDVNGNCGDFSGTVVTGNTFGDCGGITLASPGEITGNDLYKISGNVNWILGQGFGGTITGNTFDNGNGGASGSVAWIHTVGDISTGEGAWAISGNSAQAIDHGQGGPFIDAGGNESIACGNAIMGGFSGGYAPVIGGTACTNSPGFTGGAAYNNSTAYIVGDYVSYGSLKYVCISNTTGNLPTNATFWTALSSNTIPLAAWYKGETILSGGSGTPITSWPDSSGWPNRQMTPGAGSTLYESSSTAASLPGARFTGTSFLQETEIQFGPATTKTIFIAVNPVSINGGAHEAMVSGLGTLTPYAAYDGFGNVLTNCCGGGGTYGPVTAGTRILEFNISNPLKISDSGTIVSLTGGTAYGWSGPGGTLSIGATGYDGTGPEFLFSGDIADVMVFNGTLSSADAAIVGGALCSKYAVTCSTSW